MTRVDNLVTCQLARKLVHEWQALERDSDGRIAKVDHASLLDQLREKASAVQSGESEGNAAGKPVVSKMPVPQEAALSMAIEIETELARIAIWLGASAKSRDARDNYDYLVSFLDDLDDVDLVVVTEHLARLVRSAEIELEQIVAPRRLLARCPGCKAYGAIFVHFANGDITKAMCHQCEAIWGRHQLGLLNHAIDQALGTSQADTERKKA